MNLGAVLNADMATVGGAARGAFVWWLDELRGIAAPVLRAIGNRQRPLAMLDEHGERMNDAAALQGATLVLPGGWSLERTVSIPAMSSGDVDRMLQLEGDRFVPLPAAEVLVAGAAAQPLPGGRLQLDLAALPRARAVLVARTIEVADGVPAHVRPRRADGLADPRFDFMPAMRAAGLLPRGGAKAQRWWAFVAFLLLLNIGTLVWRDAARVEQLRTTAESQRGAVAAAKRIAVRIERTDRIVRQSLARRAERDALGVLAAATEALPDGAWVQRYTWTGTTLRLTGYRGADVNVTSALRRSARFAAVRTARSDSLAEISAGTPFDVIADVRGR